MVRQHKALAIVYQIFTNRSDDLQMIKRPRGFPSHKITFTARPPGSSLVNPTRIDDHEPNPYQE
jgi:hypothetical protein